MPEFGYTIKPARYAKGQMAIHCERDPNPEAWTKTRAMRLAADGVKGRYSNREKAYIVSPAKAARFERLFAEQSDADVMTGEIFAAAPPIVRDALFSDLEPTKAGSNLQDNGTKAFSLKASSIVSAAQADLNNKVRNAEPADDGKVRWYTFHRKHVRKAESPAALLRLALGDRERGLESGKPNTRMIYGDEELLKAALELAL